MCRGIAPRVVIFDIDPDIREARTLSTKVYGDPGLFIVQRLRVRQLHLFISYSSSSTTRGSGNWSTM